MAESGFRIDEALRKEFEEARRCYKMNEVNKFCILCRTNKPDEITTRKPPYPLILNSVLKSEEQKLSSLGTEVEQFDISRLHYRGYCEECKRIISRGEQCFDQFVYTPLVEDCDSTVHVEGVKVVDVYHCALSVWWRFASLSELAREESPEGKAHRKLLESVRVWLRRPRKFFPFRVWVFLTALHPESMAHLKSYSLGTPAIGCYTNKDTWFIPLGPLMCWFKFMKVLAEIPNAIHIGEGMSRLHLTKECVEKHMANVDAEQRRLEFEAAKACFKHRQPNHYCILCRRKNPSKKVQLSHIIPHSVLKSGGEDLHAIGPAGQEVGRSKLGYHGYCKQCENMLSSKGEQNFNETMHKPLVENYNSAVCVERENVAGVYHCALSIWWRYASLFSELVCEESSKGKSYRKLLKDVRAWLHKPEPRSLPFGVQVSFLTFHPNDLSYLETLGLHLAATKVYGGLMDLGSQFITSIHMGPLLCMYTFMQHSEEIPCSIHIKEGNARSRLKEEEIPGVVKYMKGVKELMLQLEARASNETPHSSEPYDVVESIDLIPKHKAVIHGHEVIDFPYHRHIRQVTCLSRAGRIQVELYKHNTENGDEPPYQGMASIPTVGGGFVRVWLQSDDTGRTFTIHKDAPVTYIAKEALDSLKQVVASLRVI